MVTTVTPIDFDTAFMTPEGRLELAREYFAAHQAFFVGAEDERMNKIYAACREEIAELARESLKEKIVPRPGIKILFPIPVQHALTFLEDSIPPCIQNTWARAINILHIPIPVPARNAFIRVFDGLSLEDRKRNNIISLCSLVAIVFFYIVACIYI